MPLGVFLHLSDRSSGYIPEECESLRQSLFPASRVSRIGGDVQAIPFLLATVYVRDRLSVLCLQRCAPSSDMVSVALPGADYVAARYRSGTGLDCIVVNHQIP